MTDDVVNSWGVTSSTLVYLDSRLHIATYQTQLLNMEQVMLCNSNYLSAEEGDNDGCPNAGLYSFNSLPLQLPSVPNKVYDWAATGWTGSATIDMYLDSNKYQLVGRCQLNLVTHMDDSSSSSNNNIVNSVMQAVPEAGVTGMILLGTCAALLFLWIVGSSLTASDDFDDDSHVMGFKQMRQSQIEAC